MTLVIDACLEYNETHAHTWDLTAQYFTGIGRINTPIAMPLRPYAVGQNLS